MPEQPPAELTATLERLGLATAAQVAKMRRRVGRLARDLPQFESVWVDALSQARVLTPYQAAELNAGRGQSLRVGPYLLCERLAHPCYVESYRAKNVESQEPVRLAILDNTSSADRILDSLNVLAAAAGSSSPPGAIRHVGVENGRVFAAAPWGEGRTAAEWMVHHGRFPPEVVLEIAQAMLGELVELEKARICHGNVSTSSLVLSDTGSVALVLPGLRPILRPEEGFAHADLRPEAYDSLAPERVSAGTRSGVRSDIYACGCVWWHLLCGRPPLIGGNSLAKLRAAQTGEIPDVRRYAPDVPQVLAAAISACLEHEPSRRPESMARLADRLGPPTRGGKDLLVDCLSRAGRPTVRWTTTVRSIRRSNRTPLWIAGAVCCLATVVAVLWPAWHGRATVEPPLEAVAAKGEGRKEKGNTHGRDASHAPANRIARAADSQTQNPKAPPALAENHDGRVVGAAYQQVETKPADLVLDGDKPQVVGSLALRAGQTVRGPSGRRATVLVPAAGLVVEQEDVRFENIDFVWRQEDVGAANAMELAILQLRTGRAEFCGCSFRCEGATAATLPVRAIRWVHPAKPDVTGMALPSGRIRWTDCVLRSVAAGVDCRTIGALAIELKNVLHVDSGPLVRLDHCPQAEEPVSIVLGQLTLRDSGPLLECLVPRAEGQPGEISVFATASAFAPERGSPLVRFAGLQMPQSLPAAVRWTGQGSLVTPQTPIVTWRASADQEESVDESSLSIAGLVRSEVVFAGKASSDPASSRLVRWQAPLQSADPPGIDPAPLPRPGVPLPARPAR